MPACLRAGWPAGRLRRPGKGPPDARKLKLPAPPSQVVAPGLKKWEMEHMVWQYEWNLPYYKQYPSDMIEERVTEETDSEIAASNRWEPAPLVTAADQSGDVRSLNRKLTDRLFLLVRRKGAGAGWGFPAVENTEVSEGGRRVVGPIPPGLDVLACSDRPGTLACLLLSVCVPSSAAVMIPKLSIAVQSDTSPRGTCMARTLPFPI